MIEHGGEFRPVGELAEVNLGGLDLADFTGQVSEALAARAPTESLDFDLGEPELKKYPVEKGPGE